MRTMARPHPLLLLGLGLAGGCLPQAEPQAPLASPDAIGAAWSAVQPDGLVELVLSPADTLPGDDGCPILDVVDGVEVWSGGCVMMDGTVVEGSLQRFDGPDGAWVVGDRFTVLSGDGLQLYLDGAVELRGQGELILLDAAATTCGAHVDCQDGLVSLDLRYSLRLDGQQVADAAVRGFVALDDDDPTAVEGAWRVAPERCELEPTDGLFAAQLDQRQALELDGDDACDGCAAWTVQGQVAPPWCPALL